MRAILERLWRNSSGQDMIEYALLAATIAVVVAGFSARSHAFGQHHFLQDH